jgi:hypothetical protein
LSSFTSKGKGAGVGEQVLTGDKEGVGGGEKDTVAFVLGSTGIDLSWNGERENKKKARPNRKKRRRDIPLPAFRE